MVGFLDTSFLMNNCYCWKVCCFSCYLLNWLDYTKDSSVLISKVHIEVRVFTYLGKYGKCGRFNAKVKYSKTVLSKAFYLGSLGIVGLIQVMP